MEYSNSYRACAIGDLELLKKRIEIEDPIFNQYNSDGYTHILLAAKYNQSEIFKYLADNHYNEIDFNMVCRSKTYEPYDDEYFNDYDDDEGKTIYSFFIEHENLALFFYLLEKTEYDIFREEESLWIGNPEMGLNVLSDAISLKANEFLDIYFEFCKKGLYPAGINLNELLSLAYKSSNHYVAEKILEFPEIGFDSLFRQYHQLGYDDLQVFLASIKLPFSKLLQLVVDERLKFHKDYISSLIARNLIHLTDYDFKNLSCSINVPLGSDPETVEKRDILSQKLFLFDKTNMVVLTCTNGDFINVNLRFNPCKNRSEYPDEHAMKYVLFKLVELDYLKSKEGSDFNRFMKIFQRLPLYLQRKFVNPGLVIDENQIKVRLAAEQLIWE